MKKFQFKFETVRKLRESAEQEALKRFAQAQRNFRDAIEKKNHMIQALEDGLSRREKMADFGTKPAALSLEEDFITGTKVRIFKQDQVILKIEKKLRKAFKDYLQARKEKRMMEKLRENALSDYRKEARKAEERTLNDLYVMRAGVSTPLSLIEQEEGSND